MVRHTNERRATEVAKSVLKVVKNLTLEQKMVMVVVLLTLCAVFSCSRPAWALTSGNNSNADDSVSTSVSTTTTATTAETTLQTTITTTIGTTTTSVKALDKKIYTTTASTTSTTTTTIIPTETVENKPTYNEVSVTAGNVVKVEGAVVVPQGNTAKVSTNSCNDENIVVQTTVLPKKDSNKDETVATSSTESTASTTTETQSETTSTDWLYGIKEDDTDFILLCNAVGHEAGSYEVAVADKAKVVEVICNRKDNPNYPDTIYGVLTQRKQFSGASTYVDLGTYSKKVSEEVKEAVRGYLAGEYENHGYLSFYGDGHQNHFY